MTEIESRDILKKLNSRVVHSLPDNKDTNDIYICGVNDQVNLINRKYKLEPGCKVICNIKCSDLEKKIIPNGSIGMVECISDKLLKIRWDDNTISSFKGIGKTLNKNKPRFTPAYALTIHKAQGKTIKRNVIINPSRLFAKNHLYVALTRATKFSSIFLTEPISYKQFCTTVNVENMKIENKSRRLHRMVKQYKKEEPNLTLEFLENMKNQQKINVVIVGLVCVM